MTKDDSHDVSIAFRIELESIELDITGWLAALFRRYVIWPLREAAASTSKRVAGKELLS